MKNEKIQLKRGIEHSQCTTQVFTDRRMLSAVRNIAWILLFASCIVFFADPSPAQYYYAPVTNLVDAPTAGFLPSGSYALALRIEPTGGVLGGINVQFAEGMLIGVSYGGDNIIGSGDVDWNPRVEFEGRVRILRQSYAAPSIALGFVSQGYEGYTRDRYLIKSKGFYGVVSKGFSIPGRVGLHGGINKTLEGDDKDLDFFFGMDIGLGESFTLLGEYDFALNDDEGPEDEGYLNLGVRWSYMGTLFLEFDFRNLLEHQNEISSTAEKKRAVKLEYVEFF